jgi:hypothetical protein
MRSRATRCDRCPNGARRTQQSRRAGCQTQGRRWISLRWPQGLSSARRSAATACAASPSRWTVVLRGRRARPTTGRAVWPVAASAGCTRKVAASRSNAAWVEVAVQADAPALSGCGVDWSGLGKAATCAWLLARRECPAPQFGCVATPAACVAPVVGVRRWSGRGRSREVGEHATVGTRRLNWVGGVAGRLTEPPARSAAQVGGPRVAWSCRLGPDPCGGPPAAMARRSLAGLSAAMIDPKPMQAWTSADEAL